MDQRADGITELDVDSGNAGHVQADHFGELSRRLVVRNPFISVRFTRSKVIPPWSRFGNSGSSRIGTQPLVQAHSALDNSGVIFLIVHRLTWDSSAGSSPQDAVRGGQGLSTRLLDVNQEGA